MKYCEENVPDSDQAIRYITQRYITLQTLFFAFLKKNNVIYNVIFLVKFK